MANDLVAYSRAGDVFHYRWAARRCLKLIHPNSSLQEIYIEGSLEIEMEGEYVLDVSEYSDDFNGKKEIDYYQLKHTTVHENDPFTLSDLKDTIEGFSKRHIQHKDKTNSEISKISFTIITNRKIAESFKDNLSAIVNKQTVDKVFLQTIEKYTTLSSEDLIAFCRILNLQDGEGNYNIQKDELRIEMSRLIAGSIDNTEVNNLVALVQEKVMPDSNGAINREEILKRFGVTSERDLYPAPVIWEKAENIIERSQHNTLQEKIDNSQYPVIIHAAGGVGKSVFCRQLLNSLPEKHLGIAYDCFGAGSYRNRSETRHSHRVALVQIANELAAKGLCNPLLVKDTTLDEDIMRQFLSRIETTLKTLKKVDYSAKLFILIDAADNAEMAAKEYAQSCFAHELLREKIPQDCKLILLCRTERIPLLQPESYVLQLELEAFSKEETLAYLRNYFPYANEDDGIEFHRLTSGNPRVQANAVDIQYTTVAELLASLSPYGTAVQDQIESQLNAAVSKIKDQLPAEHHQQINSICIGLASLPPHIPLEVLSTVTGVGIEHIKSFVLDIGRSLWMSDDTIQFRDEPTETWFRETYLATEKDCQEYIKLLEPLASKLTYVAEVLPQLYLQAGQYDKLIQIALSDDYLPEDNPIDARNIRVYRLQFAFKAALRLSNFKDAIKLAMRAGEEVAGNQRQLNLFINNTDLIPVLQSKEKVQEIAFKRLLSSCWDGSENIYAASLLSGIKGYHGEARGYLRAALNWLSIYYEDRDKVKLHYQENQVSDHDILDLAYAHLNILGVKACIDFLKRFKPKNWIFSIVQDLTRRLIDIGDFKTIDEFLQACKREVYFTVAATSELITVASFPNKIIIESGLKLLCSNKKRITIPQNSFQDKVIPGIISFLEACIYHELDSKKILTVIKYYTPEKASRMVYDSHFSDQRSIFLRALAIKNLLEGKQDVDIGEISAPDLNSKKTSNQQNNELDKLSEVIHGLLPWYMLRAQILYDKTIKLFDIIDITNKKSEKARTHRYSSYDTLPYEIANIRANIIIFYKQATKEEVNQFFQSFLFKDNNYRIQNKLDTLRSAYRLPHLECIRQQFENDIYQIIKSYNDEGPDELANKYIALSRAVLVTSPEDASEYFNDAIKITSKFGDELVERWEALVSLAERSCEFSGIPDELVYRFIRCAELVGENVDREKYWNRSKALRVCTKISPGIGISAMSRWRDRDIGRFEYQFEDVLIELVNSKIISPNIGWALTPFCSFYQRDKFLSLCLENESSFDVQQKILQDAVYMYQVDGTYKEFWHELKSISSKYNLNNDTLDSIIDLFPLEKPKQSVILEIESTATNSDKNLDEIFEGIEITSLEGFTSLIEKFRARKNQDDFNRRLRDLLQEVIIRIDLKDIWDFIEVLFLSNDIDRYDIHYIISLLPATLKSKVSFKSKFEKIIYRFGQRFAHELISDSLNYFIESLNLDEGLIKKLRAGILSSLSNGEEFAQANVFFGFVSLASSEIKDQDAVDLLDFALTRFELHIDKEFGDEDWTDRLKVSDDISTNIAGYIWSALGSPRSGVRWNTAHCVRKLAEFNCVSIFDALVDWLKLGKVNAFGSFKFPFYDLHAKQYLLMAFQSISFKKPDILKKYHDLFIDYALSTKHILIQQFAVTIILNIENKFPRTYNETTLASVKNIGSSPFLVEEKDYNYSTDSYWHKAQEIDFDVSYSFGLDMGNYWYKPLGEVFGVPERQIKDLATQVIINEWNLGDNNGYNNDPRVGLWNSSYSERETYYYKSSYPSTDNLDFYLEYHAMLVVASKLLEKMPLIKRSDWIDNPWDDWISNHTLSSKNGIWLSDCKVPLPLNRPLWITANKQETWQNDIQYEDFIYYLLGQEKENTWITVRGGLHEKLEERKEVFSVTTALVSKTTSDALLRALSTCADHMDYKLPDFDEERAEIDSDKFKLKGWLAHISISKGIEEFDHHAFGVEPPSFLVDETILDRFNVLADKNNKLWKDKDTLKSVIVNRTWSSPQKGKDEEVDQLGDILIADLSFLKNLCKTLDYELIFEVSLKRDINRRYSSEKTKYIQPQYKIFILSADGKLRTTERDYKLG